MKLKSATIEGGYWVVVIDLLLEDFPRSQYDGNIQISVRRTIIWIPIKVDLCPDCLVPISVKDSVANWDPSQTTDLFTLNAVITVIGKGCLPFYLIGEGFSYMGRLQDESDSGYREHLLSLQIDVSDVKWTRRSFVLLFWNFDCRYLDKRVFATKLMISQSDTDPVPKQISR